MKFGKGRGVFSFFFSRWKYRNWCAVGIHKTDYEEKQIDETSCDILLHYCSVHMFIATQVVRVSV